MTRAIEGDIIEKLRSELASKKEEKKYLTKASGCGKLVKLIRRELRRSDWILKIKQCRR